MFGVAALAAVFTANGSYHSGQQVVAGMDPAVMIGAVLVAIGAIAAFAIKRAANTQRILPTTDSPLLAACACATCWCTQPGDYIDANNQKSPEEQEALAYAAVVGAR